MGLQCGVKMIAPACLHVGGIPGDKLLLRFWSKSEGRVRLIRYLVELFDNLRDALSGDFVRPTVDIAPLSNIVGIYRQLQALNQAVIQFAADGSVYEGRNS